MNLSMTDKVTLRPNVDVLVYGQSGQGKTMLCATCPAPVIIDIEGGLRSLLPDNIKKVFGEQAYTSIPTIEVRNEATFNQAIAWITESDDAVPFQTICIDSLSELAEIILLSAKEDVNDARQAYMLMADSMARTIRKLKNSGKHIYATAKVLQGPPAMPTAPGQKFSEGLPYLFDEVFHLTVDSTEQSNRMLQTQPTVLATAKDRSGRLSPYEPPHMGLIFQKILGG